MEKKIDALKTAYRAGNRAALVKAAKAVVAHDRKHPFAVTCIAGGFDILSLSRRIIEKA